MDFGQWALDKLRGTAQAADNLLDNANANISNIGQRVGGAFYNVLTQNPVTNYFKPTESVRFRDILREVPSSTFSVARDIQTGIGHSFGSTGLSLYNLLADITDRSTISEYSPTEHSSDLEKMADYIIFGKDSVKSIENRMLSSYKNINTYADTLQNSTQKDILKKSSLPLSVLGVGAVIGLDFTGYGGGAKTTAKVLSKMDDVADTAKVLRSVGVAEDLILPTSQKIAKITDEKEITKALEKIDWVQKNTKVSGLADNSLLQEARSSSLDDFMIKTSNNAPIELKNELLKDISRISKTEFKDIDVVNKTALSRDNFIEKYGKEKYDEIMELSKTLQKKKLTDIWNEAQKTIPIKTSDKFLETLKKTTPKTDDVVKVTDNVVKPIEKEVTPEELNPVPKMLEALKEAKPLRKEQEILYTKERSERISKAVKASEGLEGEEWLIAQKKALKGELKKVDYEGIRQAFNEKEINALMGMIKNHDGLTAYEKLSTGDAFIKMLDGKVPTEGNLKNFTRVFGKELTDGLLNKRTTFQKMKDLGYQLANLPRSLMSSFDLSAPLRQGVFMVSKPKTFSKDFAKMFKYFLSEKNYGEAMLEISNRPTFQLMKENKLAITDLGTSVTEREEAFMSNLAEQIPIIGKGVRASSRAYTGFLNRIRADVFDDFVKNGKKLNVDDPRFLEDAARFINNATGRGDFKWMGKTGEAIEKGSPILNGVFFSPRLMASRLSMINPFFYHSLQPDVRKQAHLQLFTFASMAGTVLGLAKLGGAEIETDPRSSDFAKIKYGNTRYDILGGFQQPIRAACQIGLGQTKSSTTGKINDLNGGYNQTTRFDILTHFLEAKESPIFSFAVGLMEGKNYIGEKFDVPTEIAKRFIPMVMQDVQDLYSEYGTEGIPMAIPGVFGVGSQTYGGVSTFGLKGSDYPELQKELDRLDTSMGYPTLTVYNQDITVKEYKDLKQKTGTVLATVLQNLMDSETYQKLPDTDKVKLIDRATDKVKDKVKESMFPDKKIKARIITKLEDKGLKGQELIDMTEKVYSKIDLSKLSQ